MHHFHPGGEVEGFVDMKVGMAEGGDARYQREDEQQ